MKNKIIGCKVGVAGAAMLMMLTMAGYGGRSEVDLLQMRAKAGITQAQYNLGLCYLNGNGVIRSYVAAYKWVSLSGTSDPARPGNACKYIANKMTTKQFDTAKAQAEKWQEAFKQSHLAMN